MANNNRSTTKTPRPCVAPGSVLLKISEVAARLRVAPMTVRGWIFNKKLKAVHVGRLVRVPTASLDEFLENSKELAADRKMERAKRMKRKSRRKVQ